MMMMVVMMMVAMMMMRMMMMMVMLMMLLLFIMMMMMVVMVMMIFFFAEYASQSEGWARGPLSGARNRPAEPVPAVPRAEPACPAPLRKPERTIRATANRMTSKHDSRAAGDPGGGHGTFMPLRDCTPCFRSHGKSRGL